MKPTLGDAPIEKEYREKMNALGAAIAEFFGPETGYCLMIFPFGDGPGRCNYISNAQRSDVVTLLKEQLARFEGQPETSGKA